jgi:hypothetical protein
MSQQQADLGKEQYEMTTLCYDRNEKHGLKLLRDDDPGKVRYAPLAEGPDDITPVFGSYLKQLHYVCRAHAQGLIISHVDPMLDGWQQWDSKLEFRK